MREVEPKIAPLPSVRRLPAYLRLLHELRDRGRDVVSCTHIAAELDVGSVQVRKDLAVTGIVGKPRIGYHVPELIAAIENFLGWNNASDAFLVGVGSLGAALLGYDGFAEYNLNLVAGFDIDPARIGRSIRGKKVFALEKLPDLTRRMRVLIGILTVPDAAAQAAADAMVAAGLRAIWNYTSVHLRAPESVVVEDVNLAAMLAALSNRLTGSLRQWPAQTARIKSAARRRS